MKVLQLNINKKLDKEMNNISWRYASLFYPAITGKWFWQLFPFMFSLNKQFLGIFAPDGNADNPDSVRKGVLKFVESLIPYGVVRGTGLLNVVSEVGLLGAIASDDWKIVSEDKDEFIIKRSDKFPALEQHITMDWGENLSEDHPEGDIKSITIKFKVGKNVWSEYTFTEKLMPFNIVQDYIEDCCLGKMIHRTWYFIEKMGRYMDDEGNLLPEDKVKGRYE